MNHQEVPDGTRTLTTLQRVGKSHKGELLQFLYEAGLIYKGKAIVELHGADLSVVDLSEARLSGTDLSSTHLNGANMKGVIYTRVPSSDTQATGNKNI